MAPSPTVFDELKYLSCQKYVGSHMTIRYRSSYSPYPDQIHAIRGQITVVDRQHGIALARADLDPKPLYIHWQDFVEARDQF